MKHVIRKLIIASAFALCANHGAIAQTTDAPALTKERGVTDPASSLEQEGANLETAYRQAIAALKKNYLKPQNVDWYAIEHAYDGRLFHPLDVQHALDETLRNVNAELLSSWQSQRFLAKQAGGFIGFCKSYKLVERIGAKGVTVRDVASGSAAAEAGLQPGDVVLTIFSTSLEHMSLSSFRDQLAEVPDHVVLGVKHGDTRKTLVLSRYGRDEFGFEKYLHITDPARLPEVQFAGQASVIEGAPRDGDIIESIDGLPADDQSLFRDEFSLLGSIGEEVRIKAIRGQERVQYRLRRHLIQAPETAFPFNGFYQTAGEKYFLLGMRHLDWHGGTAQKFFDSKLDEWHNAPGIVLDLRGTTGSDFDMAVHMLASLNGDMVLRATRGTDGGDFSYDVHAGEAFIHENGARKLVTAVDHPYKGKLLLVVDSGTSGVAAAMARALQTSGRAKVLGTWSSSDPVVRSVISDGTFLMKIPSAALLDPDKSSFEAVRPDYWAVDLFEDGLHQAMQVIAGRSIWMTDGRLIPIALAAAMVVVLCFGYVAYRRVEAARRRARIRRILGLQN